MTLSFFSQPDHHAWLASRLVEEKQSTSMANSEFRSCASGPGARHRTDRVSALSIEVLKLARAALSLFFLRLKSGWRLALLEESFESPCRFRPTKARPDQSSRQTCACHCVFIRRIRHTVFEQLLSGNDREPDIDRPFVPYLTDK